MSAQTFEIKGTIFNKTDSLPIEKVHVVNINSNYGTISSFNGEFIISVNKGDSLIISFIGYKTLKIAVQKNIKNIYLEKEIYDLESFTVLPYKNFNEFKDAFIQLEFPDTARNKLNQTFQLSTEELTSYVPMALFTGLLTGKSYYNEDKENYKRLLKRDKVLVAKFNPKLIQEITTLSDNRLIKDFMGYCDFSDAFIIQSHSYEIIEQTLECFEEYNTQIIANN